VPDVIAQALASRLPAAAPSAAWSTFATGLTARYMGMAASDGARTYVLGGTTDGSNGLATAQVISAAGVVANLPNMPSAAIDGVAAVVGGKLIVAAYRSATNSTGSGGTMVYTPAGADGASGTWTTGAAIPQPIAFAAGCAGSDGALWVVGGSTSTSGNGVVTTVSRYEPTANTWSTPPGAQLPAGRYYGTLIPVGTKLYYCAPRDNGNGYVTTTILDVTTPASGWTSGVSLPGTMNNPVGGSIAGQPYVYTGGSAYVSYTLLTLPAGASAWQVVGVSPSGHNLGQAAAAGSRFLAIAGSGSSIAESVDPTGNGLAAKLRTLQQYLAATDPLAYSAARRVPTALAPPALTTLLTLSPSMSEMACSSDGVNVFLSHGIPGGSFSTQAYVVSAVSTAQIGLPASILARRYARGAFLAGKHYSVGGMNSGSSMTNGVESYTPPPAAPNGSGGAWASVAGLPQSRGYVAVCAAQGLLWAQGGTGTAGASGMPTTSELWSYNPGTNAWTTRASAPFPVYGASLVNVGNFLYLLGGNTQGEGGSTAIYRYDLTLGTWSTLSLTLLQGGRCGSAVIGGKVYLVTEGNNTLQVFDPAAGTVAYSFTTPASHMGHIAGVAAAGSTLFVAGGNSQAVDRADLSALTNYPPAASAVKALTAIGGR
jgi:N-acetylneuraminic acid mutarotase